MSIPDDIYNLPLELQTALAGGYLAYWIGYTGLDPNRRAVDVAFRTFAFGLPAIAGFRATLAYGPYWAVAAGIVGALFAGMAWRTFGRRFVMWLLHSSKVHQEDGIENAWTALIQQRGLQTGQLSVHTKDGRILYQDAHQYPEAHLGGMYFGQDGSIVMVVEVEELPDGTEEHRQGVSIPDLGTRVTYIPADQITRINIR